MLLFVFYSFNCLTRLFSKPPQWNVFMRSTNAGDHGLGVFVTSSYSVGQSTNDEQTPAPPSGRSQSDSCYEKNYIKNKILAFFKLKFIARLIKFLNLTRVLIIDN